MLKNKKDFDDSVALRSIYEYIYIQTVVYMYYKYVYRIVRKKLLRKTLFCDLDV